MLCGRRSDGLWGLPKGTPVRGETLEQTARREVREETGLQVEIQRPLGAIEYWFTRPEQGVRFHKIVHHYLMTPTGGGFEQHDHEYDLVEWCPASQAMQRLTYPNEAEILRRALGFVSPNGERSQSSEQQEDPPSSASQPRGGDERRGCPSVSVSPSPATLQRGPGGEAREEPE